MAFVQKSASYQCEPPGLRSLADAGILITIVALASAAALWRWVYHEQPKAWDPGCRCARQLENRIDRKREATAQLDQSAMRLRSFQTALGDQNSRLFGVARDQLQKETEVNTKLQEAAAALETQPLSEFSIGLLALLIPTLALSVAAARLVLRHASQAKIWSEGETLNRWRLPYWSFVLVPFAVNQTREFSTSVWSVDKSWFGWSSYCICPLAWVLLDVMAFGVFLVIAYPATIIWCSVRDERRPSDLDPDAPDGAWGVGSYVLFLQTWSIVIMIFLLFPTVVYLRIVATSSRFSLEYLATGAILFSLAALVEVRLIWTAVQIRLSYLARLTALRSAFPASQIATLPGDPTKSFLGEQWWNLPATVFGTLAIFWAIVQWSGVDTLLKGLIAPGH